jgi:hypothetical protein
VNITYEKQPLREDGEALSSAPQSMNPNRSFWRITTQGEWNEFPIL